MSLHRAETDADVAAPRHATSAVRVQPGPTGLARALLRLVLAALMLGVLAAGWLWVRTRPAQAPAQALAAAVPVIVGVVSTQDLPVWLSGIGTVTPLNVVDVKVRVDGQLQAFDVVEGQEVSAGQLLARLDPRPYQATLSQALANRAKDRAQYANAQQEVARASKLASAGAGTSQALDTVRAQQATLQATLDADQAAIDAAQLNLDFTRIASPIAGRVGLRQVDAGSIVHTGDATGLVTVTQMQPIAVLFSLPQDELGAVLDGQRHGALPVAVDTRDSSHHIADGRLVFVNSTVDQTNGEIQLKAEFANTDRALWPGAFISARVLVRTDRGAVTVPAQAVLTGQDGLYVYVVTSDGTAAAQAVTTGPTVAGLTEVRAGLSAGQQVVLDGQSRLSPGARVTIAPASAQAARP